jgi:hypothetical protein
MAAELEKLQQENQALKSNDEVDRFKAETERLKLVIQYLPVGALAQVCSTVGLQVVASDDISPPDHAMQQPLPDMQMPPGMPGEQMPTDQPPQGGFSLSEQVSG